MKTDKNLCLVLDTNVFLVILAKNYRFHWIFKALIQGCFDLCVSTEILKEYEEIIAKKYGINTADSALDFLLILPNIKLTEPYYKWNLISQDEEDNKFVDCAVAGNADFIISNDRHFRILKEIDFPKITVLTIHEFDEKFGSDFAEMII